MDEALLRDMELLLLSAGGRASRQKVAELLADDFVEFGSSGAVWTRAQTLDALVDEGNGPVVERHARDLRVRFLTEVSALVTYRAERRTSGDATTTHTLRSSVWQREGNRWRMVFHQGTRCRTGSAGTLTTHGPERQSTGVPAPRPS